MVRERRQGLLYGGTSYRLAFNKTIAVPHLEKIKSNSNIEPETLNPKPEIPGPEPDRSTLHLNPDIQRSQSSLSFLAARIISG